MFWGPAQGLGGGPGAVRWRGASAVADPNRTERIERAYDGGDHLHPNAAGYRSMAAAIDPAALTRTAVR